MDPKVTSPVFMKDSMGMDYIPVYADEETKSSKKLNISVDRQKLLGIKTVAVKKKLLQTTYRTVGKVAGDKDLYIVQQEFIAARQSKATDLSQAAKRRLLLAGMSESEIYTLAKSGTPQRGLYFPDRIAWIYLNVYEQDLSLVKPGMTVKLDFQAYPGETFSGVIMGITPVINPQTRTATARVKVNNPKLRLNPEMYANAVIQIELGEHLSIPASAVIRTGAQTVVFVANNKGAFDSRKVIIGQKAGLDVAVVSGLKEGELVVSAGNFFLDSEATLQGL